MRKFIQVLIIILFTQQSFLHAQVVPDSVYYERLFYTGKVWGFLKYFHSEVATGAIDWDLKLINTLARIKTDTSNLNFNNSIAGMISSAGVMDKKGYDLFDVPDSLKYNLDLGWLDDPIFSDSVEAELDTVKTRFRRQYNYYIKEDGEYGGHSFDNDDKYYQRGVNEYPDENRRILALFRYWNIINYFYPYKNIMDQNWDSTLVEFIPEVILASNAISFHNTFLELSTRINDSHAFTYSEMISGTIWGRYYLPLTLKFIENETVVTGVFTSDTSIHVGDLIKSVNGTNIHSLRNSLRKYTAGSNNSAIERDINTRILRGQNGSVSLEVENSNGLKNITLSRNIYLTNYPSLIANNGLIWKISETDSGQFGYVDMSRLKVNHIDQMFDDLWDAEGLIFDLRNYPNETIWEMIKYLFDERIHNAKFTIPDIYYPGTLYWKSSYVGSGDFSRTYNKPIFILFNEITQSQAEYTVMAFEQHPKAIKIGSQTAGADGNVSVIYLPGGIKTYFSCYGIFYPDYTQTQRIGIAPDIELHPTIQGIREGRDEVLEYALNHNVTNIDDNNMSNSFLANNFYLYQNYPNPFNPKTVISYQIPVISEVELNVYNILGQNVKALVSKKQPAGIYKVEWEATGFASGVYLYHLSSQGESHNFSQSKKLILLK